MSRATSLVEVFAGFGISAKEMAAAIPESSLRQAQKIRNTGYAPRSLRAQFIEFLDRKIQEKRAELERAENLLEELKRHERDAASNFSADEAGYRASCGTAGLDCGEAGGRALARSLGAVLGVRPDRAK